MQKLGAGLPASILERLRVRRDHAGEVPAVEHGGRHGMVVASYNVHKCVGTDGRFDPGRIGRVIHEIGADVIWLLALVLRSRCTRQNETDRKL